MRYIFLNLIIILSIASNNATSQSIPMKDGSFDDEYRRAYESKTEAQLDNVSLVSFWGTPSERQLSSRDKEFKNASDNCFTRLFDNGFKFNIKQINSYPEMVQEWTDYKIKKMNNMYIDGQSREVSSTVLGTEIREKRYTKKQISSMFKLTNLPESYKSLKERIVNVNACLLLSKNLLPIRNEYRNTAKGYNILTEKIDLDVYYLELKLRAKNILKEFIGGKNSACMVDKDFQERDLEKIIVNNKAKPIYSNNMRLIDNNYYFSWNKEIERIRDIFFLQRTSKDESGVAVTIRPDGEIDDISFFGKKAPEIQYRELTLSICATNAKTPVPIEVIGESDRVTMIKMF